MIRISEDLIEKVEHRTCLQCDKLVTCFIFRDFMKVIVGGMGDDNMEKYPVQPKDLANICVQYHPKDMIEQ